MNDGRRSPALSKWGFRSGHAHVTNEDRDIRKEEKCTDAKYSHDYPA